MHMSVIDASTENKATCGSAFGAKTKSYLTPRPKPGLSAFSTTESV